MDINYQADWLQTVKDLHLTQLNDSFATAYLRVPEGQEEYWAAVLSQNGMIRWAELNRVIEMDL